MTLPELISIIVAAGAFIGSVFATSVAALTNRAAAKKGYVETLLATITGLQDENKRLFDRLTLYGQKLTEFQIVMDEREKHIIGLETSLRDATVGRAERAIYIEQLENKVRILQEKVDKLEKEVKRLEENGTG